MVECLRSFKRSPYLISCVKGEMNKMRKFKKTLSLLMAIVMVMSAFSATAFAAEAEGSNKLKIGVCSDIHTVVVPEEEETYNDGMFGNGDAIINMHTLSFAIVDSCAKNVKANGGQYLFICGDITNNGTLEQYAEASKKLAQIEEKHDLKILLVPGNHDYYELTDEGIALFREYFYNFGYDEAVAIDDNTNSYAYNLDDKYCLVAIDTNKPGKTGDGMTEERYLWAEDQIKAAHESGREVIIMCHSPIMPHYLLGEIITANFVLANYRKACERFADLGVKYAFTGHSHLNDIAMYKTVKGNEIYDVNTPSLVASPSEYRMVTFTDENVTFTMDGVKTIDTSLVPKGYSNAAYEKMQGDFNSYSKDHFSASTIHFVKNLLSTDNLLEMMGASNSKALKKVVDGICTRANEVLFAPLYGEKDSFEAIAKKYNMTIPESDYATMADVALEVIRVFYGMVDKGLTADSVELELAITGIGMLLTYVLADVPNDVKFAVIDAVFSALGIDRKDLGVEFTEIVLKGSDNPQYAFDVVHSVVDPILDGVFIDGAPADREVVLPAYSAVNDKVSIGGIANIFKKIVEFVTDLIKYIYNIVTVAK